MSELIQEYSTHARSDDDVDYFVRAYAEERADGTWAAWIEFHPVAGNSPILRTGQETSQPNRVDIEYWASGLEPIYFEGALERARAQHP